MLITRETRRGVFSYLFLERHTGYVYTHCGTLFCFTKSGDVVPTFCFKMAAAMIKHVEAVVSENNASKRFQTEISGPNKDINESSSSSLVDKGKRLVNSSKTSKKSTVPACNKTTDQGPGPSQSQSQAQNNTTGSTLPQSFNKEALSILREMNLNINKTNEKVEHLSRRVDELYDYDMYDEIEQDRDSGTDQQQDENDDTSFPPGDNQDENEHSVFGRFSKTFKKSDVTSNAVDSQLAELVNDAFREGMSDDQYQNIIKDIHRPENCPSLKETKVNPGVWSVLRQHTQMEDSKLRGIQNCFVKAACNLVKILDTCAESFDQQSLELGMNAVALLGQANKWLNCRRKEYHKKDMDPKLHHLCSASTSYTDMLYGDSIVKDIKDIQEMNKISRNVSMYRSQYANRRVFRGGARFLRGGRRPPYRRGNPMARTYQFQQHRPKNGQKSEASKK